MRLTAAYLAAAERNDQYSTDREWLDLDVTTYTDKVAQLVEAGQIYTDQMAFLSQARRNRAEMEIKVMNLCFRFVLASISFDHTKALCFES